MDISPRMDISPPSRTDISPRIHTDTRPRSRTEISPQTPRLETPPVLTISEEAIPTPRSLKKDNSF